MPYTTIAQAKKEGFPTEAEGVPMTIAQINKLAAIYDAVKKNPAIKIPFAVAWSQWKKLYRKVGDKWVAKKATEKLILDMKMVFPIDVSDFVFAEDGNITNEIQVLKVGNWKHPIYGKIKISVKDLAEFVKNFNNNIRKDLAITEGHSEGGKELPALGWFKQLVNKGRDGLWAVIEWTKQGKNLLQEKAYKYFSPEFYSAYEDPETHKKYLNVLVGGALTNRPYFKGLAAIVLSEQTFEQEDMLTLEDILKKEPTELEDKEVELLKEKKDELTDEQKEKFKSVLEEGEEEEEEEEEEEGKEKSDLEKVLEKDVSDLTEEDKNLLKEKEDELTEEQKDTYKDILEEEEEKGGSDVKIDKKTLKMIERNAREGVKAIAILRKEKVINYVKEFTFSEKNPSGPLLPKSRSRVVEFLLSLTEEQQKKFKEIVAELPKAKLFTELGKESGVPVKSSEQVNALANAKMEKDSKLSLRQAIEQVFAENPNLAEQVEQE